MSQPTSTGSPIADVQPRAADHDDTESAWLAAAAAVLRKAGRLSVDDPDSQAWDRLSRSTVEGLTIPPLGAAHLVKTLPPTGLPGEPPYTRGSSSPAGGGWDVRALITDPDPAAAARAALDDLEAGSTSIWLTVGGPGTEVDHLAEVLADIHLNFAPLVLDAAGSVTDLAAARSLAAICRERGVRPDPAGSLGADPIGRLARLSERTAVWPDVFLDVPEIVATATDLGVRAITVDGAVAHESGAGDAAEIGYTLACGAAYLRTLTAAGLTVDDACALLEFRYAVTDDQFVSIAKLRAARFAWHRVAQLSGVSPRARAQVQHAVTSRPMLTRYDPWVNLLRTTVAAFAAGVGGASAITVLPFDSALGIPDPFGRRLARNISALLISESHVAAVADPAGGSYAVELLTSEIAEAAWAEFQRIEAAGGILAALADGSWHDRTEQTDVARRRRIATRRQPITGVSEFPLKDETLPDRRSWPEAVPMTRWATPFEAMRDVPASTAVLLVTVGSAADASPRVLFTSNLLTAGAVPYRAVDSASAPDATGVTVTTGGTVATGITAAAGVTATTGVTAAPALALAMSDATRCTTAVLVGSDAAYAGDGARVIAALRAAGVKRVYLAGRPGADLATLVDGHIAAGDDVVAFLDAVRGELGARP